MLVSGGTSPHPQSKNSVQPAATTALIPRSLGESREGTAGCSARSLQLGRDCGFPSCSAPPLLGSTEHTAEPGDDPTKWAPAIPACSHSPIAKQNPTTGYKTQSHSGRCTVQVGSQVQSRLSQHRWRVKSTVGDQKARLSAQVSNLWAAVNRHTCRTHNEWDLRLLQMRSHTGNPGLY